MQGGKKMQRNFSYRNEKEIPIFQWPSLVKKIDVKIPDAHVHTKYNAVSLTPLVKWYVPIVFDLTSLPSSSETTRMIIETTVREDYTPDPSVELYVSCYASVARAI